MMRHVLILFIVALSAIAGLPETSGYALGVVALFRSAPRKEIKSDVIEGFALLEKSSKPYLITNEYGVVRRLNAAVTEIAAAMNTVCNEGSHIRGLLQADTEAEQKIYQAVRSAMDQGTGLARFASADWPFTLSAEVSSAALSDVLLWTFEKVEGHFENREPHTESAFLDTAPIGFFSADRGGKIISMNDTLAKLIGRKWPLDEGSPALTLSDLLVDGARRLSPALAKVGETVTETVTLRTPDNEALPIQVIQSLDISESGEALTRSFIVPQNIKTDVDVGSASGSRLVRFLDDAPVAIALTSADGTILEANDMLVEISGGAARVGANVSVAVRPDDRNDVRQRIADVVRDGEAEVPLEVKVTGDGETDHEARFHVNTIHTERGELLLNYLIDVTEMKKIEHQLAQVQKMQAVGQLAGGIAHDVNNVLTAIRGHCDLLMLRHHEGDPDFEYLNQIRSQTERAAEVISQLLAYSRRQTMRREVTQLTDTLDEMHFMLNHLTSERVKFNVKHARNLGLVRIDRSEFQRVIMNIVVNAGYAMPEGGVLDMITSNVSADDPVVEQFDVMVPGDYVQIKISDTGAGIPPDHMEKIFEPFFTTKGQGQGTGLGLSTVYGIIKQMNGFIFCESELGSGTTFRIFLPRYEGSTESDQPVVAKKSTVKQPRDLTGSGCILLVEDEDAVRSFAVRALELRGYKVLAAAGGEEALEIVMEDPDAIDLIVSDVIMPGMTGPDMMRKVREVRQDILFIFISGYAEDAFREEMLEDENFRFLPKPFSLNDLAVKVKEAFEE